MTIRELLSGGDRRSLARAPEALEALLHSPSRVSELAACTDDDDWLVRMRAMDLLEKLAHVHPEWIQPYRGRFLGPLAESEQWEIRLQVVRALPLFKWSDRERKKAVTILRAHLEHPQLFVRTWAVDSLATFAEADPTLLTDVRRALNAFETSGRAALTSRARKIRTRLHDRSAHH